MKRDTVSSLLLLGKGDLAGEQYHVVLSQRTDSSNSIAQGKDARLQVIQPFIH